MTQEKSEQNLTQFGARVEHLRTVTGMTTLEVAKRLGLSRTMLHYLTTGRNRPTRRNEHLLTEVEREVGISSYESLPHNQLLARGADTNTGTTADFLRPDELPRYISRLRHDIEKEEAFINTQREHLEFLRDMLRLAEVALTQKQAKLGPPRKEKRARLRDLAWVSLDLYECAAGGPLSAAHRIGKLRVERPGRSYPAEALFALRLNGDSMDRAGLASGDVVLCVWAERREPTVGDIVVAHLRGDGCTLKRLHGPEGSRWLEPESANPVHQRIALDGEGEPQAVIQAVMLRKL